MTRLVLAAMLFASFPAYAGNTLTLTISVSIPEKPVETVTQTTTTRDGRTVYITKEPK